jgi:hypothetical protein
MTDQKNVGIAFELIGDDFPHGWFFNRFRVERVGKSVLVTLALATAEAGVIATNAVVLGDSDLRNNKQRTLEFLKSAGDAEIDPRSRLAFSSPPERLQKLGSTDFLSIQ